MKKPPLGGFFYDPAWFLAMWLGAVQFGIRVVGRRDFCPYSRTEEKELFHHSFVVGRNIKRCEVLLMALQIFA
ncbi:hypothetical protein EII20_10135 [Comamonadaceae bacterium OH2545_COT-014]|nr:hypothetical protein EII20_10135 [Comamonadaceae bacterium OH2545_COT-014]